MLNARTNSRNEGCGNGRLSLLTERRVRNSCTTLRPICLAVDEKGAGMAPRSSFLFWQSGEAAEDVSVTTSVG